MGVYFAVGVLFVFHACSHGFLFSSSRTASPLVTFELYTRKNNDALGTGTGQTFGKDLDLVKKSNFNATLPTKVFLHGWFGAGWNWYIRDMRREMLKQIDCNFLEADWSAGSVNPNYNQAKRNAQQAGRDTADLLKWLHQNFGLAFKDVHVIGHSLGGQAAGALGRELQNSKIGRISGLDPAQPGFNLSDPNDTLGPEDAEFVDIIHTTLVAKAPMGHVDFYPNNGDLGVPVLTWVHSHLQAIYIYTETINSRCLFTAYKCASYRSLEMGECPTYCGESTSFCNSMGYHASPNMASGSLYLYIKESHPYC